MNSKPAAAREKKSLAVLGLIEGWISTRRQWKRSGERRARVSLDLGTSREGLERIRVRALLRGLV